MTKAREEVIEMAGEDGDFLIFLEPESLDEALLGVTAYQPGRNHVVAVYDLDMVIDIFARNMPREIAEEYVEFNTLGAWVGDYTPVFVSRR